MTDQYIDRVTKPASTRPGPVKVSTATDPEFKLYEPPKFDLDDNQFGQLMTDLRSFSSKHDIENNLIDIHDFLEEGKKRAAELSRNVIGLNREDIFQELMPELDSDMVKMFSPVRKGTGDVETYNRVVSQVSELQKVYDEFRKYLEPMDKSTRDRIFQELNTKSPDQVIAKHGMDVVKDVIRSYTYEDLEENNKKVLQQAKEAVGVSDDKFTWQYIEDNFKRGEPEFKFVSKPEAGRFMMQLNADPEYQKANYERKEAILKERIKNYTPFYVNIPKKQLAGILDPNDPAHLNVVTAAKKVLDESMKASEDKEKYEKFIESAREELLRYALIHKYFQQDKKTGLWGSTVAGGKKFTDYIEQPITDHIQKVLALQAQAGGMPQRDVTGLYNFRKDQESTNYLNQLEREVQSAKVAMANIRKIRKMPEMKEESNFWKQLGYTSFIDLATLNIKETGELLQLYDVTNRYKKGESLTFAEEQMLVTAAVLGHTEAQETISRGARVGRNITPMLPYIAMFGITQPVYHGVHGAIRKALGTTAKKSLNKTIYKYTSYATGEAVSKSFTLWQAASVNLGRLGGAAVQTLAQPQYIVSNTLRRAQDDIHWYIDPETNNVVTAIDENSGEQLGTALWKGYVEHIGEIYSERAGEVLTTFMGIRAARIGLSKNITESMQALGFENIAKKRMLAVYMKQKGIKDSKQLIEHISKHQLGWHGIFEEYLEEFLETFTGFITGDMTLKDLVTKEYWDEQLDTFLTVAAFGGLMGTAKVGSEMAIGNNVKVPISRIKDEKGKLKIVSENVSFPRWLWLEMAEVFTEHGVDQEGLTSLLERNKDHMTQQQRMGVLFIAKDHQEKSFAREIAELQDKREEREGELPEETVEKTEQSEVVPEVTPVTSYDGTITITEMQKKTELDKLKKDQAKMSIRLKQLNDKKEKTDKDLKEIKDLKNKIRAREGQITKVTNKYDKQLENLNSLAEQERTEIAETQRQREEAATNADMDLDKKVASVNQQLAVIDNQLDNPRLTDEQRNALDRKRSNLQGQLTRAYNDHRKAINKAYNLPENATQSEVEALRNNLTPEERAEVQKFNQEVETKHPDLVEYGLLERDEQTGQYAEPTPEYLVEKYRRVSAVIEKIEDQRVQEYDEFGNRLDMDKTLSNLYDAQSILEKYLHIFGKDSEIAWDNLFPSEKWNYLALEIAANPNLVAEIDYQTPDAFRVRLPDGRDLKGYYSLRRPKTGEETKLRERIYQAVKDPATKVVFEYQKKQDWNPKDEFTDRQGIPYGDRIVVKLRDGTQVGSIEISDQFAKGKLLEQKRAVQTAAAEVVNSLADYIADIFKSRQALAELPSKEEHHKAIKTALFNLIEETIELMKVSIEEFLNHLKYQIQRSTRLSPEYKRYMTSMINENQKAIIDHVIKKRLEKQKVLKSKPSRLKAEDLLVPSMDSPHWSADQKIHSHLRSYAKIWRELSSDIGVHRDRIESEFIRFAHEGGWSSVRDEAGARKFLEEQKSDNNIRNAIIDKLNDFGFSTIVSIFDFYENVRVVKHVAGRFDANGIEVRDMAAGLSYEEFVQSTMSAINNYEYTYKAKDGTVKKYQKGFPSVQARIQNHAAEARKRQMQLETLLKQEGTLQQRIDLKLKQHAEDLKLLEDITSIPSETWNEYFVPQTKETEAHAYEDVKPESKKSKFESYIGLLASDTWNIVRNKRTGAIEGYPKLQSNLMFNLGLLGREIDFADAVTRFFTEGSEDLNVFSNLYKLATAIKSPSEYALSGIDVKGDRFSMLSQYNMVLKLAEKILEDPRSNSIIDFYKSLGIPMEIIALNGVFGKKRQKGLVADKMSVSDIILANLAFFATGEQGIYLGSLGQFSDKGQLYYANLPKHEMPTKEQIDQVKKNFEDFDKAADWVFREIMLMNAGKLRPLSTEYEGSNINERLNNFAIHFTYNYAVNNPAVLEFFGGDMSQYDNSLVKMVKRGGSSISPGYIPNTNIIGGVGKTYRTAIINDTFTTKDGKEVSIADGVIFMSDAMAKKLAVSMGSIYNKLDLFGGFLDSSKILSSFIDPLNQRGLVKGNWLNVDLLAAAMPNSIYADIARLMIDSELDAVSFSSANKLTETVATVTEAIDASGRLKKNFKFRTENIFERKTEDLFIQQDLRHPADPVKTKQASQFLANILVLPNAAKVVDALSQVRKQQVNEFIKKFDKSNLAERSKLISEEKKKWLLENLDETIDADVIELLNLGVTLNDPGIQNYIRTKIASSATSQALDFNVMRAVTQEIPDIDGQLQGFVLSSDGKHYLLPEAAVSDPGARIHDYRFEGKPQEAIDYVNANKDRYADLYMPDGSLMEWEISNRNGVIPGEPQMLTRVPADHPHSHTIARIKFRLPGNFTMLDKDSRERSGSDFDGDARFNTSFFKDREGRVHFNNSRNGLANTVLYNVMIDYIDPANNAYIRVPIDTKVYDDLLEESLRERPADPADIRSYYYARNDNMVGSSLKGILTDVNTIFSILSNIGAKFKQREKINIRDNEYNLHNFVQDQYGAMKIHIVNMQNMAFDNAADPKLEAMGINEHTVMMFMTALMTDTFINPVFNRSFKNFDNHHQEIKYFIQDLIDDFNSPIFKRFTELRREAASQSSEKKYSDVFKQLEREVKDNVIPDTTKEEFESLKKLYFLSSSLNEVAKFIRLTSEVPTSITDFITARSVYKAVINNRRVGTEGMFDTGSLFNKDGNLKALFSSAEKVIELGNEVIYSDAVELGQTGIQVIEKIWSELKKKDPRLRRLREDQIISLSRSLNNSVVLMAMTPGLTFGHLQNTVVARLKELKQEFPDNAFLNILQRSVRKETGIPEVQISYDLRRASVTLSEGRIRKIRSDFEKLPEIDKKNFYVYAIQKFGNTTSSMRGSYFNYIGLKFRADASKLISEKIEQLNDKIQTSPLDKAFLTQWMLRNSVLPEIRNLAVLPKNVAEIIDIEAIPYIKSPWTMQELDKMINTENISEIKNIIERRGIGKIDGEAITHDKIRYKSLLSFQEFLVRERDKILDRAIKTYPPSDFLSDGEVRSMMSHDALQEAFAIEDQQLQDFIMEKLKDEYPNVEFFTDRQAFYDFVRRNGGRLFDVETNTIGHAFRNAVLVDPLRAKQSTVIHEYSHIYWDALPDGDPIKSKLRDFYRKNNSKELETVEELDERIIIDIGRLGTDRAAIAFRGSLYSKFLDLVRQFWARIKNFFGMASQKDLLHIISSHIWSNHDRIDFTSNRGSVLVRSMIESNEKTNKHSDQHVYFIGGSPVMNVTGMVAKTGQKFLVEEEASRKAQSEAIKLSQLLTPAERKAKVVEGMEEDFRIKYQTRYEATSIRGSAIHNIAEHVFSNEDIRPETYEVFHDYDPSVKHNLSLVFESIKQDLQDLKNKILIAYPQAQFITEKILGNKKWGIAGTIDLVVDVGDNKILVFDFKSTEAEYVDSKTGEPTIAYTQTYGLRRDVAQSIKLSHEGDHGLQLHLYRELIESQIDEATGKKGNEVIGMYIIPVKVQISSDNKISNAYIPKVNDRSLPRNILEERIQERRKKDIDIYDNVGWIFFEPRDADFRKVVKSMILQHEKVSDVDGKIMRDFRRSLEAMGFPEYTINEMQKAYSFLTFHIGDLSNPGNVTYKSISDLRNSSINFIRRKLYELGYKKDKILSLTSEEIFYAAIYDITPDQLDSQFSDFMVRSKYTRSKTTGVKPGWYNITVDMATGREVKDKKKGRNYILRDAGTENIREGDQVVRYYAVDTPAGRQNLFFPYKVVRVNKTRGFLVAEDLIGNEINIYGIEKDGGILLIHEGEVPKGMEVKSEFTPMFTHTEEKIVERHYKGSGKNVIYGNEKQFENAGMPARDWTHYKISMFRTWDFFNKYKGYADLYNLMSQKDALLDIYEKLRGSHLEVASDLKNFLGEALDDHNYAQAIRDENVRGATQFMPMTMQFYFMITRNKDFLFRDFHPRRMGGFLNHFKFADFLSGEYIPLNYLYSTLTKATRNTSQNSYDADELLKTNRKYASEHIDDLTVYIHKDQYWLHPSEAYDKQSKEFLKGIYRFHELFDKEYQARKGVSKMARVKVETSRLTKSEALQRAGKLGKELFELSMEQPWDNVQVRLQQRSGSHRGWTDVLDPETKQPITVPFKQIREEYAKKMLNKEDVFKYFGNRLQRYLARNSLLMNNFVNTGSLYHKYKLDAKKAYFEGKESSSGRVVTLPTIRPVSKEFGTKHTLEGHFKHVEKLIFNHYMRDVLSVYDYIKYNYTPTAPGSNKQILKYIQNQIDTSIFRHKDEYEMTDWYRSFGSYMVRWASMVYMAFQPKTQVFNATIGHLQDIVYEPGAYLLGWKRLGVSRTEDMGPNNVLEIGRLWKNYNKAFKILKRFNLANMVEETQFEKLDRYFVKHPTLSKEQMVNWGYQMLEWAEKSIQIPIFIGMMTEAEWKAYDLNAHVIKGRENDQLTEQRADELTRRVGYIHGFYHKRQASPFAQTPHGAAVFQFRKFLPSLYHKMFGAYKYDRSYHLRSGIAQSLGTVVRVATWAGLKSKQKKMDMIQEALKRQDEKSITELPFHINGMNDYFDMVISKLESDVTFFEAIQNLPANEKRNLISATIQVAMLMAMYGHLMFSFADYDPKLKKFERYTRNLIRRSAGDVVYFFEMENIDQLAESPAAGLGVFIAALKTFGLLAQTIYYEFWRPGIKLVAGKSDKWEPEGNEKTRYQQDGLYYYRGMPKILYQIGNIIPFGSAYKLIWRNAFEAWLNQITHEYKTYDEYGNEVMMNTQNPRTGELMSVGEIRKKAVQWRKYEPMIKKAVEYGMLLERGYDPKDLFVLEEYMRRTKGEIRNIRDASMMEIFDLMLELEDPNAVALDGYFREYIRDAFDAEARVKIKTDRELEKEFKRINR